MKSLLILSSIFLIIIVDNTITYELYKSKLNKLRHITLRDDAFCEAYQEFKDSNCVAKLTFCSPLTDQQTMKMRQILCGPGFNPNVQPSPHIQPEPPEMNETDSYYPLIHDYPPPYFLDVHPAQPNSFPWLAAIFNAKRRFICTGVLVSPKTVITSAQCINDNGNGGGVDDDDEKNNGEAETQEEGQRQQEDSSKSNLIVRFGRHNLNISSIYDKAYEYDVDTVTVSDKFNQTTLVNDFAILKLSTPVCNIAPIQLPKRDDWENGHYFGTRAPVLYAGWGLGHYQKPYLRSLSSALIPKDLCLKKLNWSPEQLSNEHLCVQPSINVCIGGNGTPLISTYTKHNYILLGLLSMGDHCNTPKLPLIFTKISTFINEIETIIIDDFRSMNETSPLDDCLRYKYYYQRHPYFLYPPHPSDYHKNYYGKSLY